MKSNDFADAVKNKPNQTQFYPPPAGSKGQVFIESHSIKESGSDGL